MAEGSVQHWFNHLFAFFIKGARRRGLPEKERDELLFPSILFRFLGMAVFGDPRKFFLEQSAELQVELCRRAGPLGLSPLFYYMLADTLPERWYAAFKQDFYVQSQYDFRYSRALKKVYGGFQVCETPFISGDVTLHIVSILIRRSVSVRNRMFYFIARTWKRCFGNFWGMTGKHPTADTIFLRVSACRFL